MGGMPWGAHSPAGVHWHCTSGDMAVGIQPPPPPLGPSQTPGHSVPARAGQGKGSAPVCPSPTHWTAGLAPGSPTHGGVGGCEVASSAMGGSVGDVGDPPPHCGSWDMGGVVSPAFPPPSHRCPPLRARSGAAGLGVRGTGSRRFYSPSGRGGRSRGASGGSSRRALPERSGRGWERKINHPRGRASAGSEGVQLPAAPAKSRAGRQGPSVPRPRPRPGPRRSARCAPIQMCTHPPRCARVRPGSWGTWQGCWRLSIAFMSLSSSWLSCSSSRSSSTWVGRRGEAGTARTPRPRAPVPGPPDATPSPPPARGVSPRWTEPLLAAARPEAAKGEGLVRGAPTSTRQHPPVPGVRGLPTCSSTEDFPGS